VVIKMHEAGLCLSYAVAETYSYANGAIHTANLNIGLAQPYPAVVFRELPAGCVYTYPENYTPEYLSKIPLAQAISPVRTYGTLKYDAEYLILDEAKAALRQKLLALDTWINDAVNSGWLTICNLAGFWL
jgi:hypothetical protein